VAAAGGELAEEAVDLHEVGHAALAHLVRVRVRVRA
jgi:hypothetical protein|tara:strand:+ start:335 stop:442 length:108 start_codon:yes stop_codon:yes gene_type:complete